MKIAKVAKKEFWISMTMLLLAAVFATAQPVQRMLLTGQLPTAVPSLQPEGRLDGSTSLNLFIDLPLHDPEGLTNFIEQLYDPSNPSYRQYLTPDQFDARFGPTEQDYEAVIAWANRSGFVVTERHASRMLLEVSAKVADIENAFRVKMRTYAHPTESRTFFAPDSEPSVDMNLPISNIGGLDNFARPHPMNLHRAALKKSSKANPHTIGTGPNGNLAGFDFRAAYAPGVALTGAGQTVGLLEFDGYYANDIALYESQTSVPNVPLKNIHLDGFNGDPSTNNSEVALDIEMAASMAPGLSKITVFEGGPGGVPDSMLETMSSSTYATIKQFSCSWSFGPMTPAARTSMDTYFKKFITDGQSFFEASGDSGAFTNGVAIAPPDDDPYLTVVGGTVLGTAGPGGAWLSETVWNAQEGPGFAGSSGGSSTIYSIPSWQGGVNMTSNNASKAYRNVPDVTMVADNIFIVADNGELETTGGTSIATPLWAGFIALANQQAASAKVAYVGFANPPLYNIGTNSGYTACFDDITIGNNTNITDPADFFAVPGYDLCTGWGSPTGTSLIIALTQPDGFQITPGRGAVANGPVGGPFTISTQTFSLVNTGKTAFNWSLGTTTLWLNVSSSNGALTASGGTAPVSLTLNSAATALSAGLYTADLWFTNLTSHLAQLRQFTLQVSRELALDGGFEAGDFCYWNLSGDSSIYTNNYVDFANDLYGADYTPYAGNYFAALGEIYNLAYLSQSVPTRAGQFYLLSFWLENNSGAIPNQFTVQWNSNSTETNVIFNQTNMGAFGWSNLQFVVQAATNSATLQFGNHNLDFFGLDDVSITPVSVSAPVLQGPAVVNGSLQLVWVSVPGVSYEVQYTTNLAQPYWTTLFVTNAATSSITLSESITSETQGFYRVVISE